MRLIAWGGKAIPAKDLIQRKPWLALLLTGCLIGWLISAAQAAASALELSASAAVSSEGFLTLSWSGAAALTPVALEVAADNRFSTLHRRFPLNLQILQKSQIHISGFVDGVYYARLVDSQQQVISNTAQFQVAHRNLTAAWILFAVGALLFVMLAVVVMWFAGRDTSA